MKIKKFRGNVSFVKKKNLRGKGAIHDGILCIWELSEEDFIDDPSLFFISNFVLIEELSQEWKALTVVYYLNGMLNLQNSC